MISLDDLKQRITPEPSQPNYKGLENKDKLILLIYACNYFFLAPTIKGAEAELGLTRKQILKAIREIRKENQYKINTSKYEIDVMITIDWS